MKVEIWSDFISLKSYLGKQHFKKAVNQFPHSEYVVIEHKTFFLQKEEHFEDITCESYLNNNYETIVNFVNQLSSLQQTNQNPSKSRRPNTLMAHRLAHFACTKDKGLECVDRLFTAYFSEYKLIDSLEILCSIAENIGLCPEETQKILQSNKYTRQIDIDLDEAHQIGIESLPFIVVNESFAIPGTYTADEYLDILTSIWDEIKCEPRYKATKKRSETSYCVGDHCE